MGTIAASDSLGKWWQVILFSFLHVGLLISVALSYLPPEAGERLAPFTRDVFISDPGKFFWIVAPVFAMMISKNKEIE